MATFFSGLVIGFINCWQIALITLATGPFIVAAGGVSNIFLHRLAESIQDAYAEAASVAEQVYSLFLVLPRFLHNPHAPGAPKKRKRKEKERALVLIQEMKGFIFPVH